MLSCGAAFSLREANDTEMKTTFTPYDSDDVLTATVNGSGDESKITLSAQDSSNTGARIMRFATDLADQVGAMIGSRRAADQHERRTTEASRGSDLGCPAERGEGRSSDWRGAYNVGYERACGAWVRPGVGQ